MDSELSLLKAIAEPTRLRLAVLLAVNGETCVCDLAAALDAPAFRISRHLAIMKDRGVVEARRQGTWMHYRLAEPRGEFQTCLQACFRDCLADFPAAIEDQKRLSAHADGAAACCPATSAGRHSAQVQGAIMRTAPNDADDVRTHVRARYAQIAERGSCCGGGPAGAPIALDSVSASAAVGYRAEEIGAAPEGSNLGLGCGNPQAIAGLQPGETVLDLGSGGGFDCFLAARQVGETGRVIGVDMTPEMLSRGRENAAKGGYSNVEFRLGEIEHLPVADCSVDAVLSNCVINLSPDKLGVYRETFRVLRPGGRLAISDVVATRPLTEKLRSSLDAYCGCVAGAIPVAELERMLPELGFTDVSIRLKEESRDWIRSWLPGSGAEAFVLSADIQARKPPARGVPGGK